MLQEAMLNEVFTGGLSSYSVVNMVMTHLLCMGYQLPNLPGPVGDGPGYWGSLVPALDHCEEDVGELLLSFFDHFGCSFDYSRNAVSVGQVRPPSAPGSRLPPARRNSSHRNFTLPSSFGNPSTQCLWMMLQLLHKSISLYHSLCNHLGLKQLYGVGLRQLVLQPYTDHCTAVSRVVLSFSINLNRVSV